MKEQCQSSHFGWIVDHLFFFYTVMTYQLGIDMNSKYKMSFYETMRGYPSSPFVYNLAYIFFYLVYLPPYANTYWAHIYFVSDWWSAIKSWYFAFSAFSSKSTHGFGAIIVTVGHLSTPGLPGWTHYLSLVSRTVVFTTWTGQWVAMWPTKVNHFPARNIWYVHLGESRTPCLWHNENHIERTEHV